MTLKEFVREFDVGDSIHVTVEGYSCGYQLSPDEVNELPNLEVVGIHADKIIDPILVIDTRKLNGGSRG